MRRYLALVLFVILLAGCDTGTNPGPGNALIGTWRRETDIAVFEITFTSTEYIYKVTYSQESGYTDTNTTSEYISSDPLFSVFETIIGANNISYVVMHTYYYYIKGDTLLISNFRQGSSEFYEFHEYQRVR